MSDTLKGLFLIASGLSGSVIAVITKWQEQVEWSLRVMLLLLSIASVVVGLVVAARRKRPPTGQD